MGRNPMNSMVDKIFSIIGDNFNFNLIWNEHTVKLVKVDVRDAEEGKFVIWMKYLVHRLKNPADLLSFRSTGQTWQWPSRPGQVEPP